MNGKYMPGLSGHVAAIELEIAQLKAAQGHQAAGAVELRERIADLHWIDWATVPAEDRRAIYAAVIQRAEVLGGEVVEVRVRGV
jgi:hypothetical protein